MGIVTSSRLLQRAAQLMPPSVLTIALGIVLLAIPRIARPATTWDADTGTAGAQDGTGTWDTSTAKWWNGSADVAWPNTTSDTAIIGAGSGAAGTINVSGTITLNALTFNAAGSGNYLLSGGTALSFGGTTPTLTATANATINSPVSGTALTKAGTGTLTLGGVNSFAGMTVSAGILTLANSSAGGSGTIDFRGQTLKLDGSGGNILLANSLLNNGGTLVNVAGDNKITSQLSINSGFTHSYLRVDGGTLECAGDYIAGTTSRTLHLQGAGSGTYSGILKMGINAVVKEDAGMWTLTGNNTFTGGLTVNNGTIFARTSGNALGGTGTGAVTLGDTSGSANVVLQIGNSLNLNNPITVRAGSSGTVTINNFANYSPNFNGTITLNKDLIIYNGNSSGAATITVGGNIGGNGGLVITAAYPTDIIRLQGVNNYSGATAINSGTLALSGSGSLTSLNISVAPNATFDVSGVTGGSYALNGSAVLTLAVAKSGATFSSGKINATGFTADGSLKVTASGDTLADGDTFTLFNVTPAGTFSTLPTFASGGTNWWTTDNYKTIKYNLWPTAGTATYHHNRGIPQQFTVADLLSHVTGATSGKTITLTSLAGSSDLTTAVNLPSGATLQASGPLTSSSTLILYTPASTDNGDTLTYLVGDGRGGTPSGTVSLVADNSSVFGKQSPQMTADGNGHITIKFYGVPGFSYYVQRADDVNFTQNVTELGPYAATTGNPVISLTDNLNPNGQAYYRLEWRP